MKEKKRWNDGELELAISGMFRKHVTVENAYKRYRRYNFPLLLDRLCGARDVFRTAMVADPMTYRLLAMIAGIGLLLLAHSMFSNNSSAAGLGLFILFAGGIISYILKHPLGVLHDMIGALGTDAHLMTLTEFRKCPDVNFYFRASVENVLSHFSRQLKHLPGDKLENYADSENLPLIQKIKRRFGDSLFLYFEMSLSPVFDRIRVEQLYPLLAQEPPESRDYQVAYHTILEVVIPYLVVSHQMHERLQAVCTKIHEDYRYRRQLQLYTRKELLELDVVMANLNNELERLHGSLRYTEPAPEIECRIS